jgi:hypothetical protein
MTAVSSINKYRNFSEWFDKLVLEARIVDDRFPVKGFQSTSKTAPSFYAK